MSTVERRVGAGISRLWTTILAVGVFVSMVAGTAMAADEPSFRLGDQGWAELEGGESLEISFHANLGDRLDLKLKVWRGSEVRPKLLLVGPDETPLDLSGLVKANKKGNRVQLKRYVAPRTGLFRLTITDTGDGEGGGFDLASKLKPAKKFGDTLDATRDETPLPFTAYDGDEVRLQVKTKRKGPSIRIADLELADGTTTRLGVAKKTDWLPVTADGEHVFHVEAEDDTPGTFRYKIKLKARKRTKERPELEPHVATTMVTGRLIVPGHTEASDRGGAGKAQSRTWPEDDFLLGELIVGGESTAEDAQQRLRGAFPGARYELLGSLSETGPHLFAAHGLRRRADSRRNRARTRNLVRGIARLAEFDWVELNGRARPATVPNDPRYDSQPNLWSLNLDRAWDYATGDPSVVVAMVDSGIRYGHPDLDSRLAPGYDFVLDSGAAGDGDGWDDDPTDRGAYAHGTVIAGIIGAVGNDSTGITGVMWDCKLVPVRFIGSDVGSFFDLAAAIRWAAGIPVPGAPPNANPADVINLGYEYYPDDGPSQVEQEAIQDANREGAFLVAGAGNYATRQVCYPGSYDEVVSVGAVAADLFFTTYSNWGDQLTLMAPGGDTVRGQDGILSTYVTDTGQATHQEFEGTSMASAHVSGIAGLLLSLEPSLSPLQLRETLVETAVDLGVPGYDIDYGWGLVDAEAALERHTGGPPKPPRLTATPSSVTIVPSSPETVVTLGNSGDGLLEIEDIRLRTFDYGDWLTVELSDTTAPTRLTLTVDESEAPSGTARAWIDVESSANDLRIQVRLLRLAPPAVGTVVVSARDADGNVVASSTTDAEAGFEFDLGPMPRGTYTFRAEVDRNGDDVVDQVGEWSGDYPVRGNAAPVEVDPEAPQQHVEFALARLDSDFDVRGTGGGPIRGAVAARVTDEYSGEPIAGADFFAGDELFITRTDADGRAVIFGNISGPQTLTVRLAGYETKTLVGVDAQFASFELRPLVPDELTVAVTVDGLTAADHAARFRVGSDVTEVIRAADTSPAFASLNPIRTTGQVPVRCLLLDDAGTVVGVAEGSFDGGSAPSDSSLSLTARRVTRDPHAATTTVALPTQNFEIAKSEFRYDVLRTFTARDALLLGSGPLQRGTPVELEWMAEAGDTGTPARLELRAVDAFGRGGTRRVAGTVDVLAPPADVALPSPVGPILPSDEETIAPRAQFAWQRATAAHVFRVEIEGVTTDFRWTLDMSSAITQITLPVMQTGGLVDRAEYRWRVVGILAEPSFDFADHRREQLGVRALSITTSEWRTFVVDE